MPSPSLQYLAFDLVDGTDGVSTFEAMASTGPDEHAAVWAEAQAVVDWAWRRFPGTHGAVEEGGDWDHDLQVNVEGGRWHTVTLTLSGSAAFAEAFVGAFGVGAGDD